MKTLESLIQLLVAAEGLDSKSIGGMAVELRTVLLSNDC